MNAVVRAFSRETWACLAIGAVGGGVMIKIFDSYLPTFYPFTPYAELRERRDDGFGPLHTSPWYAYDDEEQLRRFIEEQRDDVWKSAYSYKRNGYAFVATVWPSAVSYHVDRFMGKLNNSLVIIEGYYEGNGKIYTETRTGGDKLLATLAPRALAFTAKVESKRAKNA